MWVLVEECHALLAHWMTDCRSLLIKVVYYERMAKAEAHQVEKQSHSSLVYFCLTEQAVVGMNQNLWVVAWEEEMIFCLCLCLCYSQWVEEMEVAVMALEHDPYERIGHPRTC